MAFLTFLAGVLLGVTLSGVLLIITFYLEGKDSQKSPIIIMKRWEAEVRDKGRKTRERPVIIKAPTDEVEAMEEIFERNASEGRDTKLEELI